MKNPGGRPIKYTEEYVENELNDILYKIQTDKNIYLLGQVLEYKEYSPQRISEWAKKYTMFSETIKKIKSILEERINRGGLEGKLNPTMAIFNLKNNYGWKDRQEVEVDNVDPIKEKLSQLPIEELLSILKEDE